MLVGNHIDNPFGIVESLLANLQWAALLVDGTGRIWAANLPAHFLLAQPIDTLVHEPVFDYVTAESMGKLHELLHTSPPGTHTTTTLEVKDGLRQVRECVAHVVALPLTSQRICAVVLNEQAQPARDAVHVLSAASAAGFEAQDTSSFFACLHQAFATQGLDVHVALLDPHYYDLNWIYSSIDPAVLQSIQQHLGWQAQDLFASSFPALDTLTEPMAIAAPKTSNWVDVNDRATFRRLVVNLLWCHRYIVIPLSAHKQIIGVLVVSGPNVEAVDVALLKPFGQLFGLALDRLRQQTDFISERAYTSLLLKAGRAISEVTALDEVLRVICDQALILTGGMTAALWQPDVDQASMRCIMAVGAFADYLLEHRSPIDAGMVGRVFLEQRSVIVDDLAQQPVVDPIIQRVTSIHSAIFQVLQIQGRPVAVLAVGHQAPNCFRPAQLDVLEQYSLNAAVAIENAHLHESIRRSEERYRSLFQNASEIVITLDLHGCIVSWNRAALTFLGLTFADTPDGTINFYDLLLPETADWLRFMQERTLQGYQPNPTEIEIRRADGSFAVIEVTMQMFVEHGQPAGVYIIGRDMTERQIQQRALTDQVAQLTALHKLSMALSSALDRDVILQQAVEAIAYARRFDCVGIHLIHANNQYLELTAAVGLDAQLRAAIQRAGPDSVLWGVWQSGQARMVTTQELRSSARPSFERLGIVSHTYVPLISTSGTYGVLAIGQSGTTAFTEGEFQVLQTMAAQIARALENIDLYAAVERSAARYRDLYENANDLVGQMTTKGNMLSLNRAALRFFGYSPSDLVHLTLHDLLPPDDAQSVDQVLEVIRQSTQGSDTHELEVVRHDGSRAILEMRSRLVYEGETPTAIHFIARDITERRQLEAQVRQGEKLAALGQLVAGAAHELNNPLAVVLGMSQLLLRNPLASELIEDIQDIEAAAQRAKHIVNQMLTFARAQQDVRGPVDLALLVNRVVLNLRRNLQLNDIRLEVQLQQPLPAVWGDAYQIEQVLDNLLHNAIHALANHPHQPRAITISATARETHIRLNVVDNGPGIPPHVLSRIFDPFFTTKEVGHGIGLGLSLVYGIINKHGGTIQAESVLGQGATFSIELPVSQANVQPSVVPMKNIPKHSSILVVEDEVDVRMILERALTQHGYDVDAVDSAEAALRNTAAKRYDLVISDLRMPGMNGNELFEQVHITQPQLSWVFITGDTMSASSETFLKQSGAPFLAKPFTLEELWDAVATSILSERQQPSQAA